MDVEELKISRMIKNTRILLEIFLKDIDIDINFIIKQIKVVQQIRVPIILLAQQQILLIILILTILIQIQIQIQIIVPDQILKEEQ
jgi:hypothetical protein